MLEQIHFLLTYRCTFECDHCFVYSSPQARGVFTVAGLKEIFREIKRIPTVNTVYFEGGEAFLYYPLLLEGVRRAHRQGLKSGLVTNAYWANSLEDAKLWLRPFVRLGITDLSISDDEFHRNNEAENRAEFVLSAARDLGLPASTITIEKPGLEAQNNHTGEKGASIIGGGVKFKGRAVETMAFGLPKKAADEFKACPYEELEYPARVHLDPFGHLHICQGISLGNVWETPLSQLINNYQARTHPICRPLVAGGPYRLARENHLSLEQGYVDACHLCYNSRRSLLDKFPQYLTPNQVYGLEKGN